MNENLEQDYFAFNMKRLTVNKVHWANNPNTVNWMKTNYIVDHKSKILNYLYVIESDIFSRIQEEKFLQLWYI